MLNLLIVSLTLIALLAKKESRQLILKQLKNLWGRKLLLIFICFFLITIAILLGTYLNSPNIDKSKFGGTAQFGTFGDYIGGVLNPIFGFLTVLILLISLRKNDAAEEEDRNNIKEQNRHKKLEQMSSAVEKCITSLHNEFNKKNIIEVSIDNKAVKISYDKFVHEFDEDKEHKILAMSLGGKILSDCIEQRIEIENHPLIKKYPYQTNNLTIACIYKLKTKHIIDLFFKKIELENTYILKRAYFFEAMDFASEMASWYLVSHDELKIIREKFKKILPEPDKGSA